MRVFSYKSIPRVTVSGALRQASPGAPKGILPRQIRCHRTSCRDNVWYHLERTDTPILPVGSSPIRNPGQESIRGRDPAESGISFVTNLSASGSVVSRLNLLRRLWHRILSRKHSFLTMMNESEIIDWHRDSKLVISSCFIMGRFILVD